MYPSPEIWHDQTALALYYRIHPISLQANPGVVVASIIVSLLGSYATLTLLGRRTGMHGWRNHVILGLSVVCFATVAVWGMHFVSFQGFILRPAPEVRWYLEFSPGFTAMSLFVPLVACWAAFYFLGNQDELKVWRICLAGVMCGGMIGLMHYSASFQQPLYNVDYKASLPTRAYTIVLAILIAMIATTVAFFTFFRLRAHWQDNFLKRTACALVLAIAVCGMHYVGLWGTSFSVRSNTDPLDLPAGKRKIVRITIAVSVMCGVIVLISIGFAVWDYLSERDIRSKARKIVIASAAFDKQGRLLVRPDGHLPMHVIESLADLKDVLEELDPRQQTFQWLYSLSFNWKILNPFIPRIRSTIARRHAHLGRKKKGAQTKAGKAEELVQFRSRFIEAAYELAEELELPLEKIGTMFDRVLTTGTRKAQVEHEKDLALGKRTSRDDESSIHGITLNLPNSEGKLYRYHQGVMLFVVREIADGKGMSAVELPQSATGPMVETNQDNIEKYLSKGYRMADVKFFSGILAERIGVGKSEMDVYLNALKTYAKRGCKPVVQAGGVYLGLYGVRPSSSRQGGVDVLVYNFARHQIPAYRLPEVSYPLSSMMKGWIREISNMTLFEVLQNANNAIARAEAEEQRDSDRETQNSEAEELLDFQTALAIAAEALGQAMRTWPNLYGIARLSPEILDTPSSINDSTTPAQMIVLEAVLPSPMQGLTPSVSRSSVAKGGEIRPQISDKPPQPFVFTPYCLFSIAQTQILQGKTSHTWSKDVTTQLAKLYSSAPTDVLAELDEAENPDAVDPFTNNNHPNFPHHKKGGSQRAKALPGLNLLDRSRRGSNAASLTSANYHEDEMEKGIVMSPGRSDYTVDPNYPPTSPSSGGLKRFLCSKGTNNSPGLIDQGVLTSPAPAYSTTIGGIDDFTLTTANPARAGTDGWHARAMRTLERSDQGAGLLGCQW